jgi:hypothetical protein
MKFKDAGKNLETIAGPASTEKYYPKFSVDLDQFPDLKAEMDDSVELVLRGRVCRLESSEYCNTMEVEVLSVAVPSHTHDSAGDMNTADKELGRLKSHIERGY